MCQIGQASESKRTDADSPCDHEVQEVTGPRLCDTFLEIFIESLHPPPQLHAREAMPAAK